MVTIFFILIVSYQTSPVFQSRVQELKNDIQNVIYHDDYTGSAGKRIALWRIGFSHFKDNFFFGEGIGDERSNLEKYKQRFNLPQDLDLKNYSYHNIFLNISSQLGILGLLSLLVIFYSLIKLKFQLVQYQYFNYSFIFIFLLLSLSHGAFHGMHPMTFFALFAGLLNTIAIHQNKGTQ